MNERAAWEAVRAAIGEVATGWPGVPVPTGPLVVSAGDRRRTGRHRLGLSRTSRLGVVVRARGVLENLGRAQTTLLDQTGTLTTGRSAVTEG